MRFNSIRSKIIAFFQRIGFGILLGLIQLGLVFLGIPRFYTTTVIIIGLVLYFVIPCLASLVASRDRERRSTGMGVGFVTGLTSAILFMLVLFVLVAIALNAPRPANTGRIAPIPLAFLAFYLIALALALNFLGVLLALLGGGLGGLIGKRWVAKPARL
jgi:hypothetical protein